MPLLGNPSRPVGHTRPRGQGPPPARDQGRENPRGTRLSNNQSHRGGYKHGGSRATTTTTTAHWRPTTTTISSPTTATTTNSPTTATAAGSEACSRLPGWQAPERTTPLTTSNYATSPTANPLRRGGARWQTDRQRSTRTRSSGIDNHQPRGPLPPQTTTAVKQEGEAVMTPTAPLRTKSMQA